ncbi:MAG: hypothetical protein DME01_16255 [Candidatus Rokuibacteriota bacterium]|nr:MAG: hypothetical protein DME01_16255 [Candidatus Rokubacteria bacterium]
MGVLLLQDGKPDEAADFLRAVVRTEPQKAEPVLRKAAELGARIAPIHYHLGMTYYRLGRKEDAIASRTARARRLLT